MKLFSKDEDTLDQRTDELLESNTPESQTPRQTPAEMTDAEIGFELAHLLRGYQPITDTAKINKRLKSLEMMRDYYEKRIASCTEQEAGLKIVFQHYLNAIKLSYANIVQLQRLITTVKPYVDELNQRRDHD